MALKPVRQRALRLASLPSRSACLQGLSKASPGGFWGSSCGLAGSWLPGFLAFWPSWTPLDLTDKQTHSHTPSEPNNPILISFAVRCSFALLALSSSGYYPFYLHLLRFSSLALSTSSTTTSTSTCTNQKGFISPLEVSLQR